MSYSATLRVSSTQRIERAAPLEKYRPETLLIRDLRGRIYTYNFDAGHLSVVAQYLLCAQPGDEIKVRVSASKEGPLNEWVGRNIIDVSPPQALRQIADDESLQD